MIKGELEHNPAAHRPAADVGLLQAEGLDEIVDKLLLATHGVIAVLWSRGAAVTEQVRRVDVESRALQALEHRRPGLIAVTESMHKNNRDAAAGDSRLGLVVVHAAFRGEDVVALHAREEETEVRTLLHHPQRAE